MNFMQKPALSVGFADLPRVFPAAWRSVAVFAFVWAGFFGVSALALSGALPLWVGFLVNTALLYGSAHINHEAVHRNISGAQSELKRFNDVLGHFGSFWLFLPFPAFKAVHLAHHRVTNDPERDADMWFARKTPLGVFASCCTLLWGYEIQLRRLFKEGLVSKHDMRMIVGQRLLAVALVIAAFAMGYGLEVFMLWIGPALFVMPILAFLFAYAVHHPHSSTESHQASNVWLAPPWAQPLLTAVFMFQNYHLVHHLNPRIPFYRYGEVFRRIRPQLEAERAAIKRIF